MQGEFRGDFTHDTFDPRKQFLRVLMQQGRVQLDADWNEQVSILLHYLQTLATDLIGPYGGPADECGFEIGIKTSSDNSSNISDLMISPGRYYVDGILCESKVETTYTKQEDYSLDGKLDRKPYKLPSEFPFLVYLDVWERHITYIEAPYIREVALGGADTTTRSKIVWQVKVAETNDYDYGYGYNVCDSFIKHLKSQSHGLLRARAKVDRPQLAPCSIKSDAQYRGTENQLYRVEIHKGGTSTSNQATFKWSRENGAVVFPIDTLAISSESSGDATATVKLLHLGRDSRFSLAVGDWVEIVDDGYALRQEAIPLWKVDKIEPIDLQVILKGQGGYAYDRNKHPLLRRWDQKNRADLDLTNEGTITIREAEDKSDDHWIALEYGVQIQFQSASGQGHQYRTGDYWLIPARTATSDVEWPKMNGVPDTLPPQGVEHHYAPLAIVTKEDEQVKVINCRRKFYSLANGYFYGGEGWLGVGPYLL